MTLPLTVAALARFRFGAYIASADYFLDAVAAALMNNSNASDSSIHDGLYSGVFQGNIEEETAARNALFEGGRIVLTFNNNDYGDLYHYVLYDYGGLFFSRDRDGGVTFRARCLRGDKAWEARIAAFRKDFPKPSGDAAIRAHSQRVYALFQVKDGMCVKGLGKVHSPFEPSNYEEHVADAFERSVVDLQTSNPVGRFTILDGPPGSGKSYYLRGLVERVRGAVFIYVPAHLVSGMEDPNFLPVLFEKAEETQLPIILVLEDADAVIAKRMGDNMSAISTLLNLTDGVFGEMLDIRVIATTNQRKMDIDEALTRSMRLSQHVHISAPSEARVRRILVRLLGADNVPAVLPELLSLGEVYGFARDNGWMPEPDASKTTTQPGQARYATVTLNRRVSSSARLGFGST